MKIFSKKKRRRTRLSRPWDFYECRGVTPICQPCLEEKKLNSLTITGILTLTKVLSISILEASRGTQVILGRSNAASRVNMGRATYSGHFHDGAFYSSLLQFMLKWRRDCKSWGCSTQLQRLDKVCAQGVTSNNELDRPNATVSVMNSSMAVPSV
jgi:hypothetical protein